MIRFGLGFLTGAAILWLAVTGYLTSGLVAVRSDVAVPGWAASLISSSTHASVRRAAPRLKTPLPAGDETLIAGGKLYLDDCVGCHGAPGKPPSEFGSTFYPPAPQFPIVGTKYQESEVFWVAKHGIRRTGMAAQASSYSDNDLWSLAAFITHILELPPQVAVKIQQKQEPQESSTELPK